MVINQQRHFTFKNGSEKPFMMTSPFISSVIKPEYVQTMRPDEITVIHLEPEDSIEIIKQLFGDPNNDYFKSMGRSANYLIIDIKSLKTKDFDDVRNALKRTYKEISSGSLYVNFLVMVMKSEPTTKENRK